ncbi:MAG: cytochrome C oxidase subunit IV family protein [Acidobacteriaceae bacterium]|nr:cytochrome C oxidase subunit IV family protein [Acidobacteriaceae bacterium]
MSAHVHIPKVNILVGVWASLIVLTVLTTVISHVDLGAFNIVVALFIALVKASLVVWIFMGVRFTTTLTKLFVVAGLVWLSILILLTFSDYSSRHWTYQAKPWNTHTKTPMFEK